MQMKSTHIVIVQIIQEQSLEYDPLWVLYCAQMSALKNLVDFKRPQNFSEHSSLLKLSIIAFNCSFQ